MNLKFQRKYGLILIIVGVILWAALLLFTEKSENSVLIGSYGMALALIGLFRVIKSSRLLRDKEKAEDYEAMRTDERTVFIANKARSMALYISILVQSAAGLVAYFAFDNLIVCQTLYLVTCVQCMTYYIFWIIYNKKY